MNKQVISIGGMGGSGTRVVAQVLLEAGIFLGGKLNRQLDNVLFTNSLKHPVWFKSASPREKAGKVRRFIEDLEKDFRSEIRRKAFPFPPALYHTFANSSRNNIFGWKEPNTHFYLEELDQAVRGLKYIHVIRHGLDMAWSSNRQQLSNWGDLYGTPLSPDDTEEGTCRKQLDFWIRMNTDVINRASALFGDNFYLLRHEDFCNDPLAGIQNLFDFLRFPVSRTTLDKLAQIPVLPPSSGRYRQQDISLFSSGQLQAVRSLGFEI